MFQKQRLKMPYIKGLDKIKTMVKITEPTLTHIKNGTYTIQIKNKFVIFSLITLEYKCLIRGEQLSYLEDVRAGRVAAAGRGSVSSAVVSRRPSTLVRGHQLFPVVGHGAQPVVRVQDSPVPLRLQAVHSHPSVCTLCLTDSFVFGSHLSYVIQKWHSN